MANNKKKDSSFGCVVAALLTLFVPLALVLCWCWWAIGMAVFSWSKTLHWEETEAVIFATLDSPREDSSKELGHYEYKWGGKTYTSVQISLFEKVDLFEKYELQDAVQKYSGGTSYCFVNPKKPDEAVLLRDLEWEILFPPTFAATIGGSLFFGFILQTIIHRSISRRKRKFRKLYPDEPWKWSGGEGQDRSELDETLLIVISLYWNLVSLPLWIFAPWDFQIDFEAQQLVMPLPIMIIGLVIGFKATQAILRNVKFGKSSFQLLRTPVSIGGTLEAAILANKSVRPVNGIQLRLLAEEHIQERDTDGGRTTRSHIIYEDSHTLNSDAVSELDGKITIPIFFQLPSSCEPSGSEGNRSVSWSVQANARLPGLDYKEEFMISVFETDTTQEPVEGLQELHTQSIDSSNALRALGIRLERSQDGTTEINIPPFRNFGGFFSTFLTGSLMTAFAGFMVQSTWIAFPFLIIGPILLGLSLDLLLQSARIRIDSKGLYVKRGWIFFRPTFRCSAMEVKGFDMPGIHSAGRNIYYKVIAELQSGRKVSLIRQIRGDNACKSLIEVLKQALGKE